MLEKINAAFFNDDIDLDKTDSGISTWFRGCIGLVTIDLDNINPDDDNFDENDLETFIHVALMAWFNSFKQRRACRTRQAKN